jgi:hypothetical protein
MLKYFSSLKSKFLSKTDSSSFNSIFLQNGPFLKVLIFLVYDCEIQIALLQN